MDPDALVRQGSLMNVASMYSQILGMINSPGYAIRLLPPQSLLIVGQFISNDPVVPPQYAPDSGRPSVYLSAC